MKNPKGAGRPLKYNEPTKVIGFKVPESKYYHIKTLFNRYLKKLK